jgi:hypothetical protein
MPPPSAGYEADDIDKLHEDIKALWEGKVVIHRLSAGVDGISMFIRFEDLDGNFVNVSSSHAHQNKARAPSSNEEITCSDV